MAKDARYPTSFRLSAEALEVLVDESQRQSLLG